MAGTPSLFAGIGAQFFDNTGAVLTGGKIFTYAAGTTTPVATYTTEAANVAHPNPIILDAAGRVPSGGEIWLKEGDYENYKFLLKDANDVLIATYDNVPGTYSSTNLADAADPTKGDALVGFRQSNSGGNLPGSIDSTVHKKLQEIVSVKDFGAVGDGIADDTAAIQAAIDAVEAQNGGCVYFPAGAYKVTSTLTISVGSFSIAGAGVGASFIFPFGNYGDVIHFTSNVAGTYLQRLSVRDISFYTQVETTSGAVIHLERCRLVFMSNVDISAHYGGLLLDSVVHSSFSNVNIVSDANFTSFKSGSYLMKTVQNASGVNNAECHFVNCDWRGMNGNNYLEYAVLLQAADGIWFSNVHWGFCSRAALAIMPQTTTTMVASVNVSNYYLDTVKEFGMLVLEPSGYTGVVSNICLNNGQIYNCQTGVVWNCATSGSSVISNTQIFYMDNHGVQIIKGASITCSNVDCYGINRSATFGFGFQMLNSDVQYVQIANSSVRIRGTGFIPSAGVDIGVGAGNIRISNMEFEGCVFDIADNSVETSKDIGVSRSSKEIPTANASSVNILDLVAGFELFLLDNAYTVAAISQRSGWLGRQVTLLAINPVTVTDTNNLKLNGAWSATNGDTLTLVCNGTNWYEISRSNND